MSSRIAQKAQAREARLAAERAAAAHESRRRRVALLGAVVLVAAAIVVVAALVSRSGTTERVSEAERVSLFDGIRQRGESLGSASAPVVVEEYADLQCPFCADWATRELPAVVEDYVRPGKVQMQMRLLTFLGPDSVEGGGVAAASGLQDRQWDFVESFYAMQGEENSGYVTEGFLREAGSGVPTLDVDRALTEAKGERAQAQLREARAAATAAGVQSTPAFRVGRRGEAMVTVDADGLRAAIDAAVGS